MSWKEVSMIFGTSWHSVYRSVDYVVEWGLSHRCLKGIQALGFDELHWGKGKKSNNFLTLVYQIDQGSRRLLWMGLKRTQHTASDFFRTMGPEVLSSVRWVCSDMWKPYLQAIKQWLPNAVHILDRFHLVAQLNKAVDETRRREAQRLHSQGKPASLKKSRWLLLSRRKRIRGKRRETLSELLRQNLATVRAYLLKEDFCAHFWRYRHPTWAGYFFDHWTRQAMHSRIQPMKRLAQTLRSHRPLIFNWFKAKGLINSGVVEGLNNKCRVVTRRSYGFRSFHVLQLALYHTLGNLPDPPVTHKFW
jgi:transposase